MKRYAIYKNVCEIKGGTKNLKNLEKGHTLHVDGSEPELISSFTSLEEAREELKKHKSSFRVMNDAVSYILITEFFIREEEFDEEFEEWGYVNYWEIANWSKDPEKEWEEMYGKDDSKER